MFRTHRIPHPAEAARTSSVIATTSAPRLLVPHARATREIAHARERTDPSSGEPEPPAGRRTATAIPTPTPKEHPMSIRRTLTAALAAAALVAPAAQAAKAQPADMHASVATAAAAKAQTKQDLRSPDARDAARPRRSLDAGSIGALRRSNYTAGSSPVTPASQAPAPGQPTWPAHPTTLAAPSPPQEPTTTDDGSPFPVIPVVAGALVLLIAGLGARHSARRTHHRPGVAA